MLSATPLAGCQSAPPGALRSLLLPAPGAEQSADGTAWTGQAARRIKIIFILYVYLANLSTYI